VNAAILLAALLAQEVPVSVWDTRRASVDPLTAEAIARKEGWTPASGEAAGDVVLANGRILLVARRSAAQMDVYGLGEAGAILRARLIPQAADGEAAGRAERLTLTEAGRGGACVELSCARLSVKFRLRRGERAVEAEPGPGAARLRLEAPGRFLVFPDFFADDILIDARRMPAASIDLPADHFLMHLTGERDGVALCVFERAASDVRVTMSGEGERRAIAGSEIEFGGKKIWTALLEGAGIWHAIDVEKSDGKRVLPLDWTMPYAAQWRMDFTRTDDLTDSWEMLLQEREGGDYVRPSWLGLDPKGNLPGSVEEKDVDVGAIVLGGPASPRLGPERKRWTTVLGWFQYPCWTDHARRGYVQPLATRPLTFEGPAVLYPIARTAETPAERMTVVDVMRNTLGVGPCEYLLDLEGQKQEHVGRATCHVRALLDEIFEEGRQKAARADIERYLADGLQFVTHIRGRIDGYVAFGRELQAYLEDQRRSRPTAAGFIDPIQTLAQSIEAKARERRRQIGEDPAIRALSAGLPGEPTTSDFVVALNRRFLETLAGYEGPDARERLKAEYTKPFTMIGGQQDDLVGECRWLVRAIRQKAAILVSQHPAAAPIAAAIRARTQQALRGASVYEAARH
jgi:hypothetical protein